MSESSPFAASVVVHVGPVPISEPVVTTWGIMAVAVAVCWLGLRRPRIVAGPVQAVLELVVTGIAEQIQATIRRDPEPFVPFVATLFLFLVFANLSVIIPGVRPPTATFETPAVLALLAFAAAHVFGIRERGLRRHLLRYLKPNPLLLPLNVLSELTRTVSLAVRLFGNIMSHEFAIGLLLAIAGLLVPVPIMALGILIGLVQAYIFTVLTTVFVGAAVESFEAH